MRAHKPPTPEQTRKAISMRKEGATHADICAALHRAQPQRGNHPMNYIDNPQAYDVVKIAGQILPGEVSFGEVKRELSKKHKRGSGNDGAEPTYGGLKPTSLTIKCVLHTAEDEEAWQRARIR